MGLWAYRVCVSSLLPLRWTMVLQTCHNGNVQDKARWLLERFLRNLLSYGSSNTRLLMKFLATRNLMQHTIPTRYYPAHTVPSQKTFQTVLVIINTSTLVQKKNLSLNLKIQAYLASIFFTILSLRPCQKSDFGARLWLVRHFHCRPARRHHPEIWKTRFSRRWLCSYWHSWH